MKVTVKKDLCIACGSCYAVCDSVFEGDDEGKSKIVEEYTVNDSDKISEGEVPSELVDCAKEGAEVCPTEAIEIS